MNSLKQEAESEWHKREVALRFTQLKSGETVGMQSKKALMNLAHGDS